MGQAEAERWISLKSSLQLGGGGGGRGWRQGGGQVDGRMNREGGVVGCVRRSVHAIFAALASTLDPADKPSAACSFFIARSSCTHKDMASPKQNVGTLCLHCQLRPDCWACPWADMHTCLRSWWSFCPLWNVWAHTWALWLSQICSPKYPLSHSLESSLIVAEGKSPSHVTV